ncbi:tumor necrosis factor alpha-induced protein 2 [Ascaphus truei]|uniref:tumor necrosis factor alpha-induced protein 2 n=1 Tax=Ascaphus truei TaxID=8439 RepID=UPI003F5AABC8
MKKIILKMLMPEEAHKAPKENKVIEPTAESTQKTKKKTGVYKGLKKGLVKYLSPKKSEGRSTQSDCNYSENITAENIQEHILQKRYWNASKDLITLEQDMYHSINDKDDDEKRQEFECIYKKLEAEVSQVIKDSVTTVNEDLLEQAVMAIVEQEKEDSKCLSETNRQTFNTARPRQWKQRWLNDVKQSVVDRINDLPEVTPDDSTSTLSMTFIDLGKTFKKDLIQVVKHLKPHYPEEFDVCNTYAKNYHQFVLNHIDSIAEYELGDKDTNFLLSWVHNIYPNNILRDPTLVKHIDETRLESLLPPQKIRDFEGKYLSNEVDSVKTWMNRSLDMEVKHWKEGKEPELLGDCYHSELQIDVIQSYNAGIIRAAEITTEMSQKIRPLLAIELEALLRRYKSSFEEYKEKNKNQQHFNAIIIANINSCRSFRNYIESNDAQLENATKQNMSSILVEFESLAYDVLLQDLIQDLKSYFRKLSQGNGLCSHQTMCEIVKKAERCVSNLTTLKRPCFQDVVGQIHIHLVKEYITRLLKKKVSHKNTLQLQNLACQFHETANLMNAFFSNYESTAAWLSPVIPKLAEIIRLQDLSAIQLEVAALADEYSDIGKKHVEAILYIKGNLSRHEVKSILGVLSTERRSNPNPALFSLLKLS